MAAHDNQEFLQAIIAQPDDDSYRLIYADWLEEHGDSDRATFIRLQLELARLAPTHGRYAALDTQERALRKAHFEEWIAPLRAVTHFYKTRSVYRRGFVEYVQMNGSPFLKDGAALFRLAPIRHLRMIIAAEDLPRLAESATVARLRELHLTCYRTTDEQVSAFLRSNYLAGLQRLSLGGCTIGPRSAALLLDHARRGPELTVELPACRVAPDQITELATAFGPRIDMTHANPPGFRWPAEGRGANLDL